MQDSSQGAYRQAVTSDAYFNQSCGMFGRFDNVYRQWEDPALLQSLNHFLRALGDPFLSSPWRVIDLGCGAGKGLELLSGIKAVLRGEMEEFSTQGDVSTFHGSEYLGIDLSTDMIEKAREIHGTVPNVYFPSVQFEVADLNEGLPSHLYEKPFDIFFSSYGTLSHLKDPAFKKVIQDIARNMGDQAILVVDLLGRGSPEWPLYWNDGLAPDQMRPYSMSHIVPPGERKSKEIPFFPMRFWTGEELLSFLNDSLSGSNVHVSSRFIRDRSILCGRHMDTGEYRTAARPTRQHLNSLLELDRRTDLSQLIFTKEDLEQKPLPETIDFFHTFIPAWNYIILETCTFLKLQKRQPGFSFPGKGESLYCEKGEAADRFELAIKRDPGVAQSILGEFPVLASVLDSMERVVKLCRDYPATDPVATLVEPALAFSLRRLEEKMQKGLGVGHTLLGFFELTRKKPK